MRFWLDQSQNGLWLVLKEFWTNGFNWINPQQMWILRANQLRVETISWSFQWPSSGNILFNNSLPSTIVKTFYNPSFLQQLLSIAMKQEPIVQEYWNSVGKDWDLNFRWTNLTRCPQVRSNCWRFDQTWDSRFV